MKLCYCLNSDSAPEKGGKQNYKNCKLIINLFKDNLKDLGILYIFTINLY